MNLSLLEKKCEQAWAKALDGWPWGVVFPVYFLLPISGFPTHFRFANKALKMRIVHRETNTREPWLKARVEGFIECIFPDRYLVSSLISGLP